MRVLIADDNRDAADTLAMIVRLWGHDAHVVYDGASALTVARTFKPDVALLDIQMPRVNGGDVALYLRRQAGLEGTTFIAISAGDPHDERLADYQNAFDIYLRKPCDLDELHNLLSSRSSSGGCLYESAAGVR